MAHLSNRIPEPRILHIIGVILQGGFCTATNTMKLFCGTTELDLKTPVVMGILNVTPDSFHDGGRYASLERQVEQAGRMVREGASILDLGAVSTRPGAAEVEETEELARLLPVLDAVVRAFPGVVVSVDTFRPEVARVAADHGAGMINDIYGGRYDALMLETVAGLGLPYVLMHMRGTPATMQDSPEYGDVVAEVGYFFEAMLERCRVAGIRQVIIDPGFGFGKTIEHNFALLNRMETFAEYGVPLLAGLSRKSMICRTLGINPDGALNGTTVMNTIALLKGAGILRVHDVREAMEAIRLISLLGPGSTGTH